MMQAVLSAQRAGVMHNDLVEQNFLVMVPDSDGCSDDSTNSDELAVVLLDFGNAISVRPDEPNDTAIKSSQLRLEREHACGIMKYRAGEQATKWMFEMLNSCKEDGDEFGQTFWDQVLEIDAEFGPS
jgi:hypothetical protein